MLVANAHNGQTLVHRHDDAMVFNTSAVADNVSSPVPSALNLQSILERSISFRTSGRVRFPQVRTFGSRVVVSGWAKSYHAIQLALAGLLETYHVMGLDRPCVVELDIEVISEDPAGSTNTEPMRAR
jgi:hypothetical protein